LIFFCKERRDAEEKVPDQAQNADSIKQRVAFSAWARKILEADQTRAFSSRLAALVLLILARKGRPEICAAKSAA
jgi:hypothetical protein